MKSIKSKVVAATITEAAQPSRVENVNGEGRSIHGMGWGWGGERMDGACRWIELALLRM